jgi:uncharacterized protein (DUF488 family)
MSESIELLTLGYGRWPAKTRGPRLVEALKRARVELLVDIRHSPCASNLDPAHHYGPRDWHVRPASAGIVTFLRQAGIEYRWLVELGNPQKTDPGMAVLREHLADPDGGWPVHRGLAELRRLVVDERRRCCLLCACEKYEGCHRKVVAEAFRARAGTPEVKLVEVG